MEEFVTIECPYCGQGCEVAIDISMAHQQFVTDCEVCCRPFTVQVEAEDGEIVRLDVEGN